MTGNINVLSTRSGDTEKAMDGITGRDIKGAGRAGKENREVSDTGATEIQVEQQDTEIPTRTVRTRIATDRTVQEKYQEQKSEEKAAQAKEDAITAQLEWIEENLVPADVEDLEEEATPYEEYTSEQLERALQRVKEGRAARREGVARQVEKKRESREQVQDAALSETEKKLAERLEAAGMPVTQANLEKLAGVLEQAEQALGQMGDRSFSWLLENGLESSVANIYQASLLETGSRPYSNENQSMTMGAAMVSSAAATGTATDGVWAQIEPQAAARLEQEGIPVTEETMQDARWLFEQGQAIDSHNMAELASLQQLKEKAENLPEEIMERLTDQLALGGNPADTVLGDARQREAEYAVTRWNRIEPESLKDISARRQIEEIRLKLTTEAAVRLLDQGIRLDTDNLSQIVESLRELEQNYYQKLCAEQGDAGDSQAVALLQEVTEKRQESLNFSLYALGSVYRSAGQITFEAFYEEGSEVTSQLAMNGGNPTEAADTVAGGSLRMRAETAYENMATEVRSDLGDSIRKAFRSVDSLLEGMELTTDAANERAVRILGYNGLEITPESVAQMRYYDSRVSETLQEMKPGVVLQMIRNGQNPLQMTMEELGDTVREITDGIEAGGTLTDGTALPAEESYSRFLWKLEKQKGISEEERSAYIGIYRLLYQIEKSDGAAVGAVVEAGQELTLEHLLTAVRTRRSGGIDRRVDAQTGERTGTDGAGSSITEQIDTAWRQIGESARQLRRELEQPEEEYRQWQTEQLVGQVADSREAVRFLQEYGMESSPVLLEAAKTLLSDGWRKESMTELTEVLSPEEQERLKEESEQILQRLGDIDTDSLQEQVRQLQETVVDHIRQEEQTGELTFERLQQLRSLGQAMSLSRQLTGQEHYEIPVVSGDGALSCIRLTVRHAEAGSGSSGHLELSMALPETGEQVKGDFWVREEQIEGYFRTESRQGEEEVSRKLEGIRTALEAAGYETGSLTCHLQTPAGQARTQRGAGRMNAGSREKNTAASEESGSRQTGQIRRLYEAARVVIDMVRYQEGENTI